MNRNRRAVFPEFGLRVEAKRGAETSPATGVIACFGADSRTLFGRWGLWCQKNGRCGKQRTYRKAYEDRYDYCIGRDGSRGYL